MSSWKTLTAVAVVGALGGGAMVTLFGGSPVSAVTSTSVMAKPVVEVMAEQQATSQQVGLAMTGQVEAEATIQMVPQVSGVRIQEVLVKEGERVRKGQLLVKLDASVQQLAVLSSENQVEKVKQQRVVLDAQLLDAKNVRADAEVQLRRVEQLMQAGTQSQEQLDAKRVAFQSAEARVIQLQAQLDSLRSEEVIARNDRKSAQIRQGYTVITAPTDGVIGTVLAKAGDVAGTSAILTIESARKQLKFSVPSDIVPVLNTTPLMYQGEPVALQGLSVKEGVYVGSISVADSVVLGSSGSVVGALTQRGVKVPISVLKKDSRGWYVWGLIGDKVSKAPVTLAQPLGEQAVIVTPLPATMRIITSGTDFLYEGLAVTAKESKV